MPKPVPFSDLQGKIIESVRGAKKGSGEIIIQTECGFIYRMYHEQDCCERVEVEDVEGDIEDLIGEPLVLAEESVNLNSSGNYESATWTFYRLATEYGFVVIRWLGESNGYYSESVRVSRESVLSAWA